jgi:hypothetical protein
MANKIGPGALAGARGAGDDFAGRRGAPSSTPARPRHLYREAYHESGHVVVALSLGHEFTEAVLYDKPLPVGDGVRLAGAVLFADLDANYPCVQLAAVSYGGPIAESRWTRQPLADILAAAGSLDLDDVVRFLARSQFNAFCAEDMARQRLRRHWRAVERIAEVLVEHRSIDYATALVIFREKQQQRLEQIKREFEGVL